MSQIPHLAELRDAMFFGVIGNFAGHLEQAKEAASFACDAAHPDAPKGVFPIYLPGRSDFLGRFCVASEVVLGGECVQIEPEVAIDFSVYYDAAGAVCDLVPRQIAAFNDASQRIAAPKISQKKNFSAGSKGLGNWLPFEGYEALARMQLCSYLRRDGQWHEYGARRSCSGYCYFAECLEDWLIAQLNEQKSEGILDELAPLVASARVGAGGGYGGFGGAGTGGFDCAGSAGGFDCAGGSEGARPTRAIICIGATPYTDFGASNYLRAGDELFVALAPEAAAADYRTQPSATTSCLRQSVR